MGKVFKQNTIPYLCSHQSKSLNIYSNGPYAVSNKPEDIACIPTKGNFHSAEKFYILTSSTCMIRNVFTFHSTDFNTADNELNKKFEQWNYNFLSKFSVLKCFIARWFSIVMLRIHEVLIFLHYTVNVYIKYNSQLGWKNLLKMKTITYQHEKLRLLDNTHD